jgi:hypothetical protein
LKSDQTESCNFDDEQADIVKIVKGNERKSENSGEKRFSWNKFNGDLACRVVKEFLRRHMQTGLKITGPNAFIDGYPTEFDLLMVTENAIPRAFTNAYRAQEVRFVIEVKSHGYMKREFPTLLLLRFEDVRKRYPNVNCTYLTIRETWNPRKQTSISFVRELKKVLEPRYRIFCLSESRTHDLIAGQWEEFVNHLTGS